MSLLTIIQDAAFEAGLKKPVKVIGATDRNTQMLVRGLYSLGKDLLLEYLWPQLVRTHTFDTVAGRGAYPLPRDFARHVPQTAWNADDSWPLYGPLSAEDWATLEYGVVSSLAHQHYRCYGADSVTTYAEGLNQFTVRPVPAGAETLALEYITRQWLLPKEWSPSENVSANDYRSVGHRIYTAAADGTTGSTLPVHTSGSASDGGVTWAYWNTDTNGRGRVYSAFLADDDQALFDEELLSLGTALRYREVLSLPVDTLGLRYQRLLQKLSSAMSGTKPIDMSGRSYGRRGWNFPETNFG